MTVERSWSLPCDPTALFGAVTDNGRKADTIMFESAAISDEHASQSLLFVATAVRVTCRDGALQYVAKTENGIRALRSILGALPASATIDDHTERATVHFPKPSGVLEDSDRIRRSSPTDGLRAMTSAWTLEPDRPIVIAGAFAYDFLDSFEDLPPALSDPLGYPDFEFCLPETLFVIDHSQGTVTARHFLFGEASADEHERAEAQLANWDVDVRRAVATEPSAGRTASSQSIPAKADAPEPCPCDPSDAEFGDLVRDLKKHIELGDVFQIVPSRTFTAPCPDPFAVYRELRVLNPSPYMFYLASDSHTLFGASPETCVKVSRTDDHFDVEVRPIAGTRPRGFGPDGAIDPDTDDRCEAELRLNDKELSEHMMLVDLARNDVARISQTGTRRVDRLLTVERYSHVMHLVSNVKGALRPEFDALHAYVASMNMGTLTGAPKIEAARILRTREKTKRGPYGGAVCYLTSEGEFDSGIIIRSAMVRDGQAYVRAGAGVVADSDPAAEVEETTRKADAVLAALALARAGAEATP